LPSEQKPECSPSDLATKDVAASTQNQAFNGIEPLSSLLRGILFYDRAMLAACRIRPKPEIRNSKE
jgi:hypothetical protein